MSKSNITSANHYVADEDKNLVKFEFYGTEMIEKDVRSGGNSGRIYLPPKWIGRKVKIVKIE